MVCKDGIYNGRCCEKKCKKGQYMAHTCTENQETMCEECGPGLYTVDDNNLRKCRLCDDCSPTKHLRTKSKCFRDQNAQCECEDGFFCTVPNAVSCTHCEARTKCAPGSGYKNSTGAVPEGFICEPCPAGTFSNVTDSSPCLPHNKCEGGEIKLKGTATADAVCGPLPCYLPKHYWMVPVSLWVGLIVFIIIIVALCYWKNRRQSQHIGSIPDDCPRGISTVLAPDIVPPPTDLFMSEIQPLSSAVETSFPITCDCTLECEDVASPAVESPTSPMRLTPLPAPCGLGGDSICSTVCQSEPQEDEWPGA